MLRLTVLLSLSFSIAASKDACPAGASCFEPTSAETEGALNLLQTAYAHRADGTHGAAADAGISQGGKSKEPPPLISPPHGPFADKYIARDKPKKQRRCTFIQDWTVGSFRYKCSDLKGSAQDGWSPRCKWRGSREYIGDDVCPECGQCSVECKNITQWKSMGGWTCSQLNSTNDACGKDYGDDMGEHSDINGDMNCQECGKCIVPTKEKKPACQVVDNWQTNDDSGRTCFEISGPGDGPCTSAGTEQKIGNDVCPKCGKCDAPADA